jgi:uncharacterized membrane protein YraQ (UPF0718 family)
MAARKGSSGMLASTIVLGIVAVILVAIGIARGGGQHVQGLKIALKLTWEIAPLILFAMVVAGMIQVLIPRELVARWVGGESGFRGILIGTVAGALSPGGPYINIPLVAVLLRGGAGIGTTVAFLTAWSLISLSRLPMEIGILGWRFTAVRMASSFFFPPIAGLIALALARSGR